MARRLGLSNIHIAKVLTDTTAGTTYETPIKLERAITANMEVNIGEEKLYSDNGLEEIARAFDSIDVEIELNQLSLESRALLQGSKLVKGQLQEGKDDVAPQFAMGFESKKTNGKRVFVWLYKGSFKMTSDEFETTTDSVSTKSASLTGTFYARDFDGKYRNIADEEAKDYDKTINGDVWYTKVVEPATV